MTCGSATPFGLPYKVVRVDLAKAKNYWHWCSDLCHMQIVEVWSNEEACTKIYDDLLDVKSFLEPITKSVMWSNTNRAEAWIADLEKSYVAGTINEADVIAKLKETGTHIVLENSDGSKEFMEGYKPAGYVESDSKLS